VTVVEFKEMTLAGVKELAQKGNRLVLEDFTPYYCNNKGHTIDVDKMIYIKRTKTYEVIGGYKLQVQIDTDGKLERGYK